MKYENYLVKTNAMIFWFVVSILMIVAIFWVAGLFEVTLLDEVSSPGQVRDMISAMSDTQRLVHGLITSTLDVIFPLAYGALFIGGALRYYPKIGKYIVVVVLISVICDLIEGVVQVLALAGAVDLVSIKSVVTPVKTYTFLLGGLALIIGLVKALVVSKLAK